MKNKLLKLTMIVVIAIAVILGVYKIGNSVMFDEDVDKTVANDKNTILEMINNTKDEIDKNDRIKYYINRKL